MRAAIEWRARRGAAVVVCTTLIHMIDFYNTRIAAGVVVRTRIPGVVA